MVEEFQHAISVADAASLAAAAPEEIHEIHLDAAGITGGIVIAGVAKSLIQREALRQTAEFTRLHGRTPVALALTVARDPQALAKQGAGASNSALVAEAKKLPTAKIDTSKKLISPGGIRHTESQLVEKGGGGLQKIPAHFPSQWEGDVFLPQYNPKGVAFYGFTWNSATGHSPKKNPAGFGLELGFTLWNDNNIQYIGPSLGGNGVQRRFPACGKNQYRRFFLNTWQQQASATLWTSNIPPAAVPYADFVISLDTCNQNGLEFGIGRPRELKADQSYWMQSVTGLGIQREKQSTVSASASLKQNNCGALFLFKISSACMGLNVKAKPPGGLAQAVPYLARSRGWVVPG